MGSVRPLWLVILLGCSTTGTLTAPARDYFLVFLRRPADAPHLDAVSAEQVQSAHMANIKRLYEQGRLVAAGPFTDDTSLRGLFVFKALSRPEAEQLLATDPAVRAGRLIGDVHAFRAATTAFRSPSDANVDMENYSVAIFHNSASDAVPHRAIESRHTEYLAALDRNGTLAFATLFNDHGEIRAITILTVPPQEAATIAESDPLVAKGRLTFEIHSWISRRGVLPR
jgi:uncharacterized protein YciI